MTETISLETRQCLSGEMIGMPPPTDASKAMSTPAVAAASMTSWPLAAMSALFAVTTDLPALSAPMTTSRATPTPPMSSMTMSMSGSAMMAKASSVTRSAGMPSASARSVRLSATRVNSMSTPALRRKSSLWRLKISTTPDPTVPRPMRPTLTVRMWDSFRGLRVPDGRGMTSSAIVPEERGCAVLAPRCGAALPLFAAQQVVVRLPAHHHPGLPVLHEHDCGPNLLVVVARHRLAVGAGRAHADDVADLNGLDADVARDEVAGLAVLARDGHDLAAGLVGLVGHEHLVVRVVQGGADVVGHAAVDRHVGADAGDVLDRAGGVQRHAGVGHDRAARLHHDLG